MNSMEININCDLGEKSKHHSNIHDPDLLSIVNSANVACGYHAGDEETMHQVVDISKTNRHKKKRQFWTRYSLFSQLICSRFFQTHTHGHTCRFRTYGRVPPPRRGWGICFLGFPSYHRKSVSCVCVGGHLR